jgi:hypothetical protein
MPFTIENDIITIRIQLNELRSRFDRAMRENETFNNLKSLHLRIKEMECYLNAMEWHASKNTSGNSLAF